MQAPDNESDLLYAVNDTEWQLLDVDELGYGCYKNGIENITDPDGQTAYYTAETVTRMVVLIKLTICRVSKLSTSPVDISKSSAMVHFWHSMARCVAVPDIT